ncbi:glycoside hydrolase family 61 protein [Collybia nuda]|uniref:lytic cellulose monooxygenase (C4-dehydrogenating) n=1 Tax=Collybia nuda TaxID=64659 RepID=A0A9P5Y314_9AGAR|nr:glycoside hydrolase family 61 protein [Collybia nuda]
MFKSVLALSLLSILVSVHGHGYVQEVVVDSVRYSGYLPDTDPYEIPPPQRIVRKIPGTNPVMDLDSIDIQCNGFSAGGSPGSAPAPIFATVAAGSSINVNWTTMLESHLGSILTYMAHAPTDITKWNPGTSAVWFKIDEVAKTANGTWATINLFTNLKGIYNFTIPANLKPGQYIIRHEIITLQTAGEYPGVQVYPSCIQVEVTGSGTAFPTSFVSFPGAYNASTPGIVFDLYLHGRDPYPIPGPPVWS